MQHLIIIRIVLVVAREEHARDLTYDLLRKLQKLYIVLTVSFVQVVSKVPSQYHQLHRLLGHDFLQRRLDVSEASVIGRSPVSQD